MLFSPTELAIQLGERIRRRRLHLGWTQVEAAARAGVSHRTWRRLECEGKASIDDLLRAGLALRCEREFDQLFPAAPARNMDELLTREKTAARPVRYRRTRPIDTFETP
jgi:transcriptional regulator with XRE-family HTH domain